MKNNIAGLQTTLALAGILALGSSLTCRAQSILTNGGFETGGFDGWSVAGPFTSVVAGPANTGSYSAQFGAGFGDNGSTGDLMTQTVATTPGASYDISIWVLGTAGGGPADVYIQLDGQTIYDAPNTDFSSWTQIGVTAVEMGSTATVGFGSYTPNIYNFDDASVTIHPVPEPSPLALLAVGGIGAFMSLRRRN